MLKTIIVLPDGTEISSGTSSGNAVQSVTYTECVNSGTELTLGSVCAAMVEIKFITPDGGLSIAAGDEITVYKDDGNARHMLGIFIAEKPTRPSAHTMKLTAFDRISKLDKDLTEWLAGLTGWPYSLYEFAGMVCDACGVELTNTEIPNGSYLVQAFSASGVTGRNMMQWAGEAAGRFCRATADGKVEFSWYSLAEDNKIGTTPVQGSTSRNIGTNYDEDTGTLTLSDSAMTVSENNGVITITSPNFAVRDDGNGTVMFEASGSNKQKFYYQGGLTFEDYQIAPIEKVQIHANEDDVGVIWPNVAEALNTYRITGNMLLTDERVESLRPVVQTLYEQLKDITYTPCSVSMPANLEIRAGHIVPITDRNGRNITAYVMTKKQTGQKDTIECTGSIRRDSVSAVNEQSFQAISGKVLNLKMDVEGLKVENKATDGRIAALELNVDGISTQVEKQTAQAEMLRTDMTALQQTANEVQISIQSIQDNGVSKVQTGMGYTFNDEGMKISRVGEQMENKLDNTGMYVTREGETILQANNDGVVATDVRVKNYLRIGDNSRFEDYGGNRTACFYVGG